MKCIHCYFYRTDQTRELTDPEWINIIKEMKSGRYPFSQCTWIGGEPLLRRDLVEEGMKYFATNTVVTNGTIPLPDWKNCNFYVSVDGTRDYYCRIRGTTPATYDLIKKNVNRADLKIIISFVIMRENSECIEEMVEEWSKTAVRGIIFDFYTPALGEGTELWLDFKERDVIISRILALKKKYPGFILIPEDALNLMDSIKCKSITDNCLVKRLAFSLDSAGKSKKPCMLGETADCNRCGCIVPFYLFVRSSKINLIREAGRAVLGLRQ